jgi:hypothetical protein
VRCKTTTFSTLRGNHLVKCERYHSINIGRLTLLFGKPNIFAGYYERALGHKIMLICTLGCQICQYLSYALIHKTLSWVKVFCFKEKY